MFKNSKCLGRLKGIIAVFFLGKLANTLLRNKIEP